MSSCLLFILILIYAGSPRCSSRIQRPLVAGCGTRTSGCLRGRRDPGGRGNFHFRCDGQPGQGWCNDARQHISHTRGRSLGSRCPFNMNAKMHVTLFFAGYTCVLLLLVLILIIRVQLLVRSQRQPVTAVQGHSSLLVIPTWYVQDRCVPAPACTRILRSNTTVSFPWCIHKKSGSKRKITAEVMITSKTYANGNTK